ncbi:MAG: sigma-70 family RNA polymerase sigma factor [Myxococcota bacterium]|nr:sigma-70 family RNA polymerase sigma factor [Myxococcota bacterium]
MSAGDPADPVDAPGDPRAAEAGLVRSLREGDPAAYEQLVRRHAPRMLAVARRLLRSPDDAEDAVQEAFLSAFRALDRFEGEARLGTWLHRITVNAALMKLRSRRRKPETSLEELQPRFLEDGHHEVLPRRWKDADRVLASRQLRERVREAIDGLPETYRNVLLLRDIEEMDTAETAAALGISENAVKTRLHRARVALREVLDPSLREDATE